MSHLAFKKGATMKIRYEPVSHGEFLANQKLAPGTLWSMAEIQKAYEAYLEIFQIFGPEAVGGLVKEASAN